MKTLHLIILLGFACFSAELVQAQEEPALPTAQLQAEAAPVLVTNVFKFNFVRPQIVADKVREMMGAAPGGVIVNDQSGEVEISAVAEMMEKIKPLVANLDKAREINLDVKVVQVDLDEEHLLGINWSAIVSDYKSFMSNEDNRKYSLGTVSSEDLSVLLEALETVGETKIYPLNSTKILSSQDVDVRLKAFDRDVKLKMTPMMTGAVISSDEQQDRYTARLLLSPTASGDDSIDLRVISPDGTVLTLNIKNDTVAVIGGIFTQTKSESTKKFPFLGDVPLLGIVFRDQSKVVQRLENILILTPRVTTPAVRP
jgi:type IV pilus assembly protein PilQ